MMISNQNKLLFISAFIRIIITIIILYSFNIPIFIKILLIILADFIDCDIPRYIVGYKNWVNCNENLYQKTDKITDTICYVLLLIYILKNANLSTNYNNLIILLFIYRLIGLYLFLINNNRVYLFYFPNFFLEICLGLMIINYYPILDNFKIIIILFIIILKIIQEYYLHIYKNKISK
jgi:hypothetical protein